MKTLCLLISLVGYEQVDSDLHIYMSGRHGELLYKEDHVVLVERKSGCLLAEFDGVDKITYQTFLGMFTVKP